MRTLENERWKRTSEKMKIDEIATQTMLFGWDEPTHLFLFQSDLKINCYRILAQIAFFGVVCSSKHKQSLDRLAVRPIAVATVVAYRDRLFTWTELRKTKILQLVWASHLACSRFAPGVARITHSKVTRRLVLKGGGLKLGMREDLWYSWNVLLQ